MIDFDEIDVNIGDSGIPHQPHPHTLPQKRAVSSDDYGDSKRCCSHSAKNNLSPKYYESFRQDFEIQVDYYEPDPVEINKLLLIWQNERVNIEERSDHLLLKDDREWDEWDTCCAALICYNNEYGTRRISQDIKCKLPNDKIINLGCWFENQEVIYKNSELSVDQYQRLQNLLSNTILEPMLNQINENEWKAMYKYLLEYGDSHNGDYNVPDGYIVYLPNKTEIKLGAWLTFQRHKYKSDCLPRERLERLQELVNQKKLLWDASEIRGVTNADNNKWNDMFHHLVDYGEKHNGDCNVPDSYILTLPDNTEIQLGSWLSDQYKKYQSRNHQLSQKQRDQLQKLIGAKHLNWEDDTDDNNWNDMFWMLLEYGEGHNGDCNVPLDYVITESGSNTQVHLGEWLLYQQISYKDGSLPQDKLDRLQELVKQKKFLWDASEIRAVAITDNNKWNVMFTHLLNYGEKHNGDCNAPKSYIYTLPDNKEIKLGSWLSTQRKLYRSRTLSQDRLDRLQELVTQKKLLLDATSLKSVIQVDDNKWKNMFNYLVDYGEKHNGDCNVPYNYIHTLPDNTDINLGSWLSTQRTLYKSRTLAQDRLDRLQELVTQKKLLWDASAFKSVTRADNSKWKDMFNYLVDYGEKHNGDCNVPNSYILTLPDNTEIKLGSWLSTQRTLYKSGTLAQDRLDRLQELVTQKKLLWDAAALRSVLRVDDNKWNDMYNYLVDYGEKHNGDCNVPNSYILTLPDNTEIKLGSWLSDQYKKYQTRNHQLSQKQRDQLQKLIGAKHLNWEDDTDDNNWNDMFLMFLEYGEGHRGDCNVPLDYVTTKSGSNTQVRLGEWLERQRYQKRINKLSKYRKDQLQELVDAKVLRW